MNGKESPATLGHEFSGIIDEVGENVKGLFKGQRAVVRPTIYDGKCPACKGGNRHCCENIRFIGLSGKSYLPHGKSLQRDIADNWDLQGYGGGMSRFIVAPSEHFYALPDDVSMEAGALVEPLAVAWHAVKLSPFKPNDTAIVLGGGPIGIGVIQVLKLRGAQNIILVELMENRKQLAKELGATHILDPKNCDIPAEILKLTHKRGADVIFDSAGVEIALNGIIGACRVHGTIVNIAVWEKKPSLAVNDITYSEINYMGAALYDEQSFLSVIEALSDGQLNTDKMITARIKLEDAVEKGFRELIDHRDGHCKILIDAQA
ncbi:alcohol dehydrogenase [Penicillium citrinum]|uniref:Alcohol dehydrogenase n=1 Tax=Penicillium citrinum TaxID=5077 RepID=A0A9W9NMZ2_PENCI|nr:alcohol dehydrogenase [Penicillium citrinum]KAJ5222821.1 alcohol dehydrogenase [Penicillium citrinum]